VIARGTISLSFNPGKETEKGGGRTREKKSGEKRGFGKGGPGEICGRRNGTATKEKKKNKQFRKGTCWGKGKNSSKIALFSQKNVARVSEMKKRKER